jgi:exopolysaccharide production protein ExoQ
MIPPRLIFWVCWAVALYLMWRDTKKRPEISLTVWLPTLWLMRCGSRTIDYWVGGGDLGRLDPMAIAVLLICGLVVLARRRCHWGGIVAHNSALFIFYGYLCVSTLWADDLGNPIIKIFRPVGDLVMALIVATEPKPREVIVTMFRRCSFLLIPMSIVLIRYYPDLGKMEDKHWGSDIWCGVTTHKNPLGQTCIVSALAFIWQLLDVYKEKKSVKALLKQYVALFYLALTLYVFNGGGNSNSRSSTAILCLMLGMSLYLIFGFFQKQPERVARIIIQGGVAIALIACLLEIFGSSLQTVVAESSGRNANLSDRTILWADVIRIGSKKPMLGAGYGGFWVPATQNQLSPAVDNHPEECHNGYLETFANLGLVGVALLVFVILQAWHSATKVIQYDFEYGRMRLAMILMVLVMNYSEATFPRGNHLWWYGFLIFAVYARPWVYWPEPPSADLTEAYEEVNTEEKAVPA